MIGRDVPARVRAEDPDHPDVTDPARLDDGLGGHRRRPEPVLRDHGESDAGGIGGGDHGIGIGPGVGHRLLDEHVLARARRGLGEWPMLGDRRGDHDGVDVVATEERVHVERVDAVLGGQVRGAAAAGDGHQARLGDVTGDDPGPGLAHEPGPDDPECDGLGHGQAGAATTGVTSVPSSPIEPSMTSPALR